MATKTSPKSRPLTKSSPTLTREILNRFSDPLIVVDKDTQILFANHAALKLNSGNELLGRHLTSIFKITLPDDRAPLSNPILFRLPNSDREATATFINVRALAGLRQIHRKAKSVVILQTSQSNERATTATAYQEILGTLTLRISHDFNNSLSSILGSAEYLKTVLTGLKEKTDVPDDALRFANEIIRKCLETAQAIDKLQDYARQQPRPEETIDLNEAIEKVYSFGQQILGRKITLEFIPTDDLPQFYGEQNQIDLLIMSVLNSSRETMPDGGRVTIQTETATITEQYAQTHPGANPGDYLLLTITDTGTGAPSTSLTQSFELFQSHFPKLPTDLCLPTAYAIVKHLSGYIDQEPWPGKGTKFEIYLPIHSGQTPNVERPNVERSLPEPSAKKTRPNNRSRRSQRKAKKRVPLILIAEDQRDVAQALSQNLAQAKYRTRIAHTGPEALNVFKELSLQNNRPSMVIADLGLPGIDGRTLCKQIREITRHTHLVLTTGYKIDLKDDNSHTLDGFNFLQKPFTTNTVIALVNKILANNNNRNNRH